MFNKLLKYAYMNYDTSESLVIVTNPNSTKASHIKSNVLRPLDDNNIQYTRIDTRFRSAQDNIYDLVDRLPHDGTVISAAGDGTAEQLASVALQKEGLVLGILPYGNYNDTALSHMSKGQNVLDFIASDTPRVNRNPITIEVNGKHVSDTFSYATFGLTAIIAAGFRDEASRERLRSADAIRSSIIRYGQAGLDYVKYVGNKLPDYRIEGGEIQSNRTDLAFANNPTVAGLLRFNDSYYDKRYFGVRADLNMGSMKDIVRFGLPSLFAKAPLDEVESIRVKFEQTAYGLPFQSGGEYQEIDTNSIYVYKDALKSVKYLHPKNITL